MGPDEAMTQTAKVFEPLTSKLPIYPDGGGAEDGYELWLRYRPLAGAAGTRVRARARSIVLPAKPSLTLLAAAAELHRAVKAMKTREKDLMSRQGVIGVGVGASETESNEASIVVYVDVTAGSSVNVPKRINGVRVRKVFTEPFIAY